MSAFCRPNIRTVRATPPPPGNRPSDTSGSPISEPFTSSATRWWHASAISSPPPSAAPLMAATTGTPRVSIVRRFFFIARDWASSSGASALVALLRIPRSPPAKKVFLPLVMMIPVIESFSATRRSVVSASESWNVLFIVLAPWSGSSIVKVTMPSASCSHLIMFVM